MRAIDREHWHILGPLLDRALELSPEARASWLGELRTHSPSLATEIATLLSAEELADRSGFLANPPVETLSDGEHLTQALRWLVVTGVRMVRPEGERVP